MDSFNKDTTSFSWYAIHTRTNKENDVFKSLININDIESYLPFNRFLMFWGDKQKWIIKPLFPGIIFVKTAPCYFNEILDLPHVKSFVQRNAKPVTIPYYNIDFIKKVISTKENFETRKFRITKGKKIHFDHGPLKSIDLHLINYGGQEKMVANIPFINYAILIDSHSTLLRYYDEYILSRSDNNLFI